MTLDDRRTVKVGRSPGQRCLFETVYTVFTVKPNIFLRLWHGDEAIDSTR